MSDLDKLLMVSLIESSMYYNELLAVEALQLARKEYPYAGEYRLMEQPRVKAARAALLECIEANKP